MDTIAIDFGGKKSQIYIRDAKGQLLEEGLHATRRMRTVHHLVKWSLGIEERRGKFVAMMATARKRAGILFALWRDGTTYEAKRGAQPMS